MNFTTLNIESKIPFQEIEEQLSSITRDSVNESTVDDIRMRTFNLRVKFNTKGSDWFMTVPTQLFLHEKNKTVSIKCVGKMTKPLIISFLIGGFVALFSFIHQNWIVGGCITIVISYSVFSILLHQIKRRTRLYMEQFGILH